MPTMPDAGQFTFIADARERLDTFVARAANISRSQAQTAIEKHAVFVNGAPQKSNYKLREGERVGVFIEAPAPCAAQPEDIPLSIVYEDDDIAVIDKPRGMVVHPAPGNESGTLVNALLFRLSGLSGIGGELRPGIVHRLDKDTSGLMVVAKNDAAHANLSEQLKTRQCGREYWTLVWGCPKWDAKTVDAPIGRHRVDRKRMAVTESGREAITDFTVLERFPQNALLEAKLHTGRTHQIRVHLASIGFPVAGDPVYGQKKPGFGKAQVLHARRLKLVHPSTAKQMEFESPLPDYFVSALSKLGSKYVSKG